MYWIVLITLAIDQLAKYMTRNFMEYGETIPIINNFFHLTSHRNPGAAWGIFSGQKFFLISIAFIAIIAMIFYSRKVTDKLTRIALGFFMGGAAGNLTDRFIFGEVTDMFDIRFIDYPIFNTADVFLISGAMLLLIGTFIEAKTERSQSN